MSNCAVVQLNDNVVINKIVVEPTAPAQDGCYLVLIPDGVMCDMGWIWDGANFINPNPTPEPTPEPTPDGAIEGVNNGN